MLFDLQSDQGSRIEAYVVPDTGGTVPKVRISSEGRELMLLPANVTIAEFVRAGRHSTGTCGFRIDEDLIPGLAEIQDLEIVDAETGVMIYRRSPPQVLPELNLFRLETHLLPLWRLDDAMKKRFQYWYKAIDRQGLETSTQVFCLTKGNSCYVSGRLFYKNYEYYLTKGIKTVAALRDPYHELAERLILLKNIGTRADAVLGERDALVFAPIIESLRDYERLDETFCKRFFKRAGEAEFLALSNPLTRQLTSNGPQDLPKHSTTATALAVLAGFEIVGLRPRGAEFRAALADLIEAPESDIPFHEEDFPAVVELGERLREVHAAEAFLEKDLEIFFHLAKAFHAAPG